MRNYEKAVGLAGYAGDKVVDSSSSVSAGTGPGADAEGVNLTNDGVTPGGFVEDKVSRM